MDPISGRTFVSRISPGQQRRLCDTCATRPPVYVIGQFDVEGTERNLCQRCIDRELTPMQFAMARRLAGLPEKLITAEQTLSIDELSRLAERYAGMFASMHTPRCVNEFLDRFDPARQWVRTLDATVGPDEPDSSPAPATTDVEAANLALLAMRATVLGGPHVAVNRCFVSGARTVVSRQEAAIRLARMPKPMRCRALVHCDLLAVFAETIEDSSTLEALEGVRDYWHERGGFYSLATTRSGYEDLSCSKVYCLGDNESIVVTVAAAEKFKEDYSLAGCISASPPSAFLAFAADAARAAESMGAKLFIQAMTEARPGSKVRAGEVIVRNGVNPDRPTVYELSPSALGLCAVCVGADGRWRETVTRMRPWRERILCGSCVTDEMRPFALADAHDLVRRFGDLSNAQKQELSDYIRNTVERVSRTWQHLTMPATLVDAIARVLPSDPLSPGY